MKEKFGIISMQVLVLFKEHYYPRERSLTEKDVKEKVYIFAKTIKNIFSKFIPHETILCDDRRPPWIYNNIKKVINEKNTEYRSYIQNGKSEQSFWGVQAIQNMLLCTIEAFKQQYDSRISKKLMNSSTSPKAYWLFLKSFLKN